jgi:hypothetical protein
MSLFEKRHVGPGPVYLAGVCPKDRRKNPSAKCAQIDFGPVVPEKFTMCSVTTHLTVEEQR